MEYRIILLILQLCSCCLIHVCVVCMILCRRRQLLLMLTLLSLSQWSREKHKKQTARMIGVRPLLYLDDNITSSDVDAPVVIVYAIQY